MLGTLLHSVSRIARAHKLGAGAVVLALVVAPAGAGVAAASSGRAARGAAVASRLSPLSDPTASFDNLRTGWDPNEPGLSPSVVHGSSFGQRFRASVNGQVYAQPLVIGSTLIVATENNWVYGMDASTGKINWSTSLGKPYAIKTCNNVAPNVGVTSTPVYDPSANTAYMMANVNTGSAVAWRLFGINVTTGAITFTRGIYGSPSNDSHISFNGTQELQRPGLLLLNGVVYAAFSSHCDHNPYAGYVSAVNVATGNATLWTDESGATNDMAGIWQSGGGLMSDGAGRVILASGNGISPATGPGSKPPGQLAESVIRLAQNPDGTLTAQDFFSPANSATLDAGDIDYGSAGPAELPVGTTAYPHIVVQGGKIGNLFLLNADNLGGHKQGPGGSDNNLYQTNAYGGLWGHPGIFESSTSAIPPNSSNLANYVYTVGKKDSVRCFRIDTNGSGTPKLTNVANSTLQFGYGSGSPVVTSNGNDPASAVVWVVQNNGGSNSTLVAFPAVPQPAKGGGVKLQEISGQPLGQVNSFVIPATGNNMVYVGTGDGHVLGFGVTTGAALQRGATPAFGSTAVGSSATQTATATASRTVTVTGGSVTAATSPSPFTIGQVSETMPGSPHPVPVTFPVTLHRGDTLTAPVTFAPTAPGGADGTLSFATAAGQTVPVNVPLIADATQTGLYATLPSLSLLLSLNNGTVIAPVPVGTPNYAVSTIVNGGTTPQRITNISVPGGPYAVRGLPKVGTVLLPGQSVTVQFVYKPSQAVTSNAALTVTGSNGTAATVSLSGSSSPALEKFTAPSNVSFGKVPVGQTATRFIHIVNAGNQGATVGKTALTGPFRAPARVASGLTVNGGNDLTVPVTFTPAAKGYSAGTYTFTWTDQFGSHSLTIPVNGTGF
jgi:hypothetical protein